ncbi:hypothetical protein BKA83DRAFT_4128735 [Pisolithus microcarpus]|nr:hypothetical protein BKA83DRAFT_4128735 [Pisolithus microcarpus]
MCGTDDQCAPPSGKGLCDCNGGAPLVEEYSGGGSTGVCVLGGSAASLSVVGVLSSDDTWEVSLDVVLATKRPLVCYSAVLACPRGFQLNMWLQGFASLPHLVPPPLLHRTDRSPPPLPLVPNRRRKGSRYQQDLQDLGMFAKLESMWPLKPRPCTHLVLKPTWGKESRKERELVRQLLGLLACLPPTTLPACTDVIIVKVSESLFHLPFNLFPELEDKLDNSALYVYYQK